MSQTLTHLSDHCLAFPSIDNALSDPNGLLAIGGDLSPERILNAYKKGIFPWFSDGEPPLWWSPNPRTIIQTDEIRINKSLRKFLKKSPYKTSINKAFNKVIKCCADAPFRNENTWILPEMVDSYVELHKQGHAHSVEVWFDEELVGGLYGVAINGFFSGESMFYAKPNASKVALVSLAKLLKDNQIDMIDCQLINPFLEQMGAKEITRQNFKKLMNKAIESPLPNGFWTPRFL